VAVSHRFAVTGPILSTPAAPDYGPLNSAPGAFSITLRRACSRTRRRPSRGTVAARTQTAGFHPTTQEPTMTNDSRHHAETKDEYCELNYVKDHKSDYDSYVKQHKYEGNDEHTNCTYYCNEHKQDYDKYTKDHKNDYDKYSTAKNEYNSQNYAQEHKNDFDYYVKQNKYEGNDPYTNSTYYSNDHKQDYDKYLTNHKNDYDQSVGHNTATTGMDHNTATTGMDMTHHDTSWIV
jgi:hypothetical protein